MADLTNRSVASSYRELLKTEASGGLTTTLTTVEDGDATSSSLQLATDKARFTGTLSVDGITTLSNTTQSFSKDEGSLLVQGGVGIEKNLNVGGDLNVYGNAVIQGTLTAIGGTLTLGDADTDNVVFNADVNSHILPNTDNTYDLGSAAKSWRNLHVDSTATVNNVTVTGSQTISATTQSTDKDTGALVLEGGLGVEKNTNIGGNLGVTGTTSLTGNTTITGDLAVNGGDLTTSAATFNLLNTNATIVNFAGAGTSVEIGSATGTTNINNNLDVDGDLNIDGGDLTVSTATFNLANTTATTLNLGGAATTLEIGAATGTTNVNNNLDVDGDVNIDGGDLTVSTATFNLANTTATTLNFAGAATSLNLGAATGTLTVANPTITGTNATALNLNGASPSIVTSSTGTASVFNTNALTGNLFGAATTISIGASTGTTTVNHSLTVAGGAGQSFVVNDGTTSRFTVDSTNGNTVVSGTLGVTGATTLTGDLAVNGGDLTTSQTTFNLLNATATTLNIGGAATTVELGAASGTTNVNNNLVVDLDLQVKGGDLTTDQTTFNLLNSTATTVNFAGAATTLELGSATGTTSINHDLAVDGNTTLGNANTDTVTFTARAASNFVPSTDNSRDLGASTLEWKDLFIDGTANIDSLVADTADINGGTIDGVTIGTNAVATDLRVDNLRLDANTVSSTDTNGNIVLDPNGTGIVSVAKALTVTGDLTTNANTTLGDANTDTVTFTARAASSLVPATDNSHDLGASALEWKDLFIDGTAKVDTLTVDQNATVAGNLTVTGDLTINGTTTNINTTNLVVEDKNVILGDVATPTNTTADGGGITLKGTTDKTLNWVNATNAWTSSEDFNLVSGKVYEINGTSVLSATSLGSGVTGSSLTSVGTIGTGTWQGTIVDPTYGGTGVNNAGKTITLGGSLTTSGAHTTTLTATGNTSVTLPTTGTLATLAGAEALTNKTVNNVTITAPASSSTLTIANGKTLTANNTLTFTGTDGSSAAFGTGGTVAYTANKLSAFAATTSSELAGVISDETGTGALVFGTSPSLTTPTIGATGANFSGSTSGSVNLLAAAVAGTTTITLPATTGTVVTTGDSGTVTSTMIANGTIVNVDVNASAAIAHSKLAAITAGQVLLGNSSNVPTATALTGDVTVDSAGATSISNNAVTNADLRDSAALSVIGNATNASADPADIVASTDHQVLRRSGSAIGFGAVNLASSNAVTGTLPVGNGGTGVSSAPTNGQVLIGNGTGFSLSTITAGNNITVTNASGTVTIATTAGAVLGPEFTDDLFRVTDNTDSSKKVAFECSGVTTATTRTITIPDVSDTLVTLAATQTLTNKTLTAPTINVNDDVFSIRDNSDTTKQVRFQISGVTTATTRTLTVPNATTTILGHSGTTATPFTWDTSWAGFLTAVLADGTTIKIPYYT